MTTNRVNISCINVRSLSDSKVDAIKADIVPKYDIICLTETNLPHANVSSLDITGYQKLMTRNRTDRQGGGVGVYAADHIGATRATNIEMPGIELMWVNITLGGNKLLLGVCYRPPNSPADFWVKLQDSLDLAKQTGYRDILLAGDFNADIGSREGNMLKYTASSNSMVLHVNKPTRITKNKSSVLDQFISNCPRIVSDVDTLTPISTCDHSPIVAKLTFKGKFPKKCAYPRHIWLYDKADYESFREALGAHDWENCFLNNEPSVAASRWTEDFMAIAKEKIPNKVVIIRPRDKPFFNTELRKIRREKTRKHNIAKRSNTPDSWNDFRQIRNKYNDAIKDQKQKCEEKQLQALKDPDGLSPKKWWKIASSILKRRTDSSYPPLTVNDEIVTGSLDKAEKFNEYFTSYATLDTSNVQIPPDNSAPPSNHLQDIVLQEEEIRDLLKSLDTSKSSGPDMITPRLLKEASTSIVSSLTRLFNLSISKKVFPCEWKRANVTPIFKKDDNTRITNYRPVSLLSCIAKLLEKAIFKHVFNFLRDNCLISLRQSGFVPGDSTVYQLTHLYHMFYKALDQHKDIRVAFCDISKAFDRVWHEGLLEKLKRSGIRGGLLEWFGSYLSNRLQRVVVDGQCSSWRIVNAGVPQGSVLGPLLFLVYINDITNVVQTDIRLFADDTTLYMHVDNPAETAQALNHDLQSMMQWANDWLVRFSAPKTEAMNISKKKKNLPRPALVMDRTPLKEVASHKHLGVTLTNDLSWHEHITNIAISANKLLDIFNAFKYKLDRRTLEKLYFSYVRSKLEYSSILWDNCPEFLSGRLEDVQIRAAKIISGATNRTSHALIYNELGWESLQQRRKVQRLSTMYNIVHGKTPTYMMDPIPEAVNHEYNLRRQEEIPGIRANTAGFQRSFYPRTIWEYNKLDKQIRQAPSLNVFKDKLKDTKHKPPDWYYEGNRKWAIHHARIRMLCSSLNDHLFSHLHVADSPECPCGKDRETSRHYFLECPLYTNERITMIDELDAIGSQTSFASLIYGSDKCSTETNIQAVTIIHNFIRDSGRFN